MPIAVVGFRRRAVVDDDAWTNTISDAKLVQQPFTSWGGCSRHARASSDWVSVAWVDISPVVNELVQWYD